MADQSNKVDLRHSLDRLYDVIASRKNESPEDSYTAQLFANAPANPARKLCEEATEVLIEALNHNKANLTAESSRLFPPAFRKQFRMDSIPGSRLINSRISWSTSITS